MYFKDLSEYSYSRKINNKHLNIGWLDNIHDFNKGYFPEKEKLLLKLKKLKTYNNTKGSHTCQLCG